MLTCDLCESSQLFASCGNLYLHMEKRHSQISSLELTPSKIKRENYDDSEENQDVKYAYTCKQCTEIFETIGSLNMHAKTTHIESKENANNLLQYKNQESFVTIQDSAGKKRKFCFCKICGLSIRFENYQDHMPKCKKYHRIVSQINDGNMLQCKICQGIFSKIGRIFDHIRVKHGDDEIAGLDLLEDKSHSDEQKEVSQYWFAKKLHLYSTF